MWVFFNRDNIGVLNEQCGQLYNSISILCSRHKCVCNVFQFQWRLCAVFIDVAIIELSFTELETVVDTGVAVAVAATVAAPVAAVTVAVAVGVAVVVVVDAATTVTDVGSISHFGHRISLLSDEWHCSCNKIAACVAKRIPQLSTLHFVVMTLFRLLKPSEIHPYIREKNI